MFPSLAMQAALLGIIVDRFSQSMLFCYTAETFCISKRHGNMLSRFPRPLKHIENTVDKIRSFYANYIAVS